MMNWCDHLLRCFLRPRRSEATAVTDQSTLQIVFQRGFSSSRFKFAVENLHAGDRCQYYKIQSLQTLRERNNQVSVTIWIDTSHLQPWLDIIEQDIKNINNAAPGLHLEITSICSKAHIRIIPNEKDDTSFTEGNILTCLGRSPGQIRTVTIHLAAYRGMDRTSCHELLHALGFGHEHQRQDRDSFVIVPDCMDLTYNSAYCKKESLLGITPPDPFSIMIYPEQSNRLSRCSTNPVWSTKPTREINTKMSELDKVGLNNLYTPCGGRDYSPTTGNSGLWYCGRYFGRQTPHHNGYCGPNNGPNCPACRVLKSDMVESLWKKGKWQGWTGLVYCGRNFGVVEQGHDGNCGPDKGPSCPECRGELLGNKNLFKIAEV